MKNNIIIKLSIFAALAGLSVSCNDFLDREPLDKITPEKYLWSDVELATYSAKKYELFTVHSGYSLGIFDIDKNSDNQCATAPSTNFIPGETKVPASGGWTFTNIRDCNYFINTVVPRYEEGLISGSKTKIEHYIGEMYFFRAYIYFGYLKKYGDFPIVTEVLSDNYEKLTEANKRRPRNEVARFILSDLDEAIKLMSTTAPGANRLTKYGALLFKSRVALYEASWLKYHAGTEFVPGGQGWPGKDVDYLKDFNIDIDSEVKFFLEEAMNAAREVADNVSLSGDYASMFNSLDLSKNKEVLLWKKYDVTLQIVHRVVAYLQQYENGGNGGGNSGYTRSLVETYLMSNGLPIYADGAGYKGDRTLDDVVEGRDDRLIQSMSVPGDFINQNISFVRPGLTNVQESRAVTGYCVRKGLNHDLSMSGSNPSYTACVVFRAAEAYLNYIEADCMMDGTLDANSDKYWKAIRQRAGVDQDYTKTVAATDLGKENDWAIYSGSAQVSPLMYSIRRERRSEFIAEGMRLDDLYRWRSLDNVSGAHMEGFNLWDENYNLYIDNGKSIIKSPEDDSKSPNVSSRSVKYLRPYQIVTTNKAYNGYTFTKAHYLSPIAFDVFRLSTPIKGGDPYTSVVYQNPGWDIIAGTTAK